MRAPDLWVGLEVVHQCNLINNRPMSSIDEQCILVPNWHFFIVIAVRRLLAVSYTHLNSGLAFKWFTSATHPQWAHVQHEQKKRCHHQKNILAS